MPVINALTMKNYIIILAAGCGQRLQNEIPKQFLLLDDLPVVMHTIITFHNSAIHPEILLVLNADYGDLWSDLCDKYDFNIPHTIIKGGSERFYSVKNALDTIITDGFVGVHDGVRPFVTEEVIFEAFSTAYKLGNAVPAVPATNTIRFFDESNSSKALDRRHVYIVQNPQVFKIKDIKAAYQQEYNLLFTDDAVVAETFGIPINLTNGDKRNIKITHPADMSIALGILAYNRSIKEDITIQNYNI